MHISVVLVVEVILLVTVCLARPGRKPSTSAFKSGHHETDDAPQRDRDDDEGENTYTYDDTGGGVYEKLDQIVYPFQQWINVRHSYSVEHLPIQESGNEEPHHESASTSASNSTPVKKSRKKSNRGKKRKLNLETAASTNNEENTDHRDNGQENDEEETKDNDHHTYGSVGRVHGSHDQGYSYVDHKPRLTEEVEDYKKQEVYEEKGYGDGAYDHKGNAEHSDHKYRYKGREHDDDGGYDHKGNREHSDKGREYDDDDGNQNAQEQSPASTSSSSRQVHRRRPKNKSRTRNLSERPTSSRKVQSGPSTQESRQSEYRRRPKNKSRTRNLSERPTSSRKVQYGPSTQESRHSEYRRRPKNRSRHLSELPTSTKILEYAASNFDKQAYQNGIYKARENIYCPEVIDFNLSSKKMGMGKGGKNPPGSKQRLRGLGDKIKCMKEKYFGVEPLPRQIFLEPSESRQSAIKLPTFNQFYNSFRDEVDSISAFQHF